MKRGAPVGCIKLRPLVRADYNFLAEMRKDQAAQHMLLAHPGEENGNFAKWLERRQQDPNGYLAIISNFDGDALGLVQMTGIHWLDRYAFAGISVARSSRGLGIGRLGMEALICVAEASFGLRKLLLHVRTDNAAALHIYNSLGFRNVGVLQAHYNSGAGLYDVNILERMLNNLRRT